MSHPSYETADEVRALNAELDQQLLALFEDVRDDELHVDPGNGEWTIDRNLGHIAEFPGYFARQLREWLDGDRVVVGRVAEHSADRKDAVVRAPERTLDELREQAITAFAALSAVLEDLRDEHLDTPTRNVKYGQEPLRAYLDRYVVGHKAAHVRQLRETIDAVRAR